jgi:hypothetical protein
MSRTPPLTVILLKKTHIILYARFCMKKTTTFEVPSPLNILQKTPTLYGGV